MKLTLTHPSFKSEDDSMIFGSFSLTSTENAKFVIRNTDTLFVCTHLLACWFKCVTVTDTV